MVLASSSVVTSFISGNFISKLLIVNFWVFNNFFKFTSPEIVIPFLFSKSANFNLSK